MVSAKPIRKSCAGAKPVMGEDPGVAVMCPPGIYGYVMSHRMVSKCQTGAMLATLKSRLIPLRVSRLIYSIEWRYRLQWAPC